MEDVDRTPLLHEGGSMRQRSHKSKDKKSKPERYDADWDPSLPYGGKVYLARRKKPDPWWVLCLEVGTILFFVIKTRMSPLKMFIKLLIHSFSIS